MTFQTERHVEVYGLGERFFNLLFPSRCVNCRQFKGALCELCAATFQPISGPTCARCGSLLTQPNAPCSECASHPLKITRIESVVWHQGAARAAVHALKYKRRRDVAAPLAQILAARIALSHVSFDLLTSVPLHPSRYRERGYNQAELLAQHTARLAQLPYTRILERTRATADQVGLDARARRTNVADAFAAIPSLAAGKTVLLIDDVATTGATLDACATALLQADALAVYGLTVARPLPSWREQATTL